jgi:pyrimidine deaminase RibD-like protein
MLRLATKLTGFSDHKFAHHGVVVTRGGAVVARGYNRGWTHAEVQALSKMWPSERRGCKVWSIRVTPGGRYAAAKPCIRCMAYLREFGVKTVYYSTDAGIIERLRL